MAKAIVIIALALCATLANAQSGQLYTFGANLSPQAQGDVQSTSGNVKVRTLNGNTLFFESSLFNAVDITAVHIHLTPGGGAVDGGPLVLALTNTSASVGLAPLSSSGNNALFQIGNRTNENLAANPQLTAARAKIVELGIRDNTLQNIGDIDRLLRQNLLYSDVHSTSRVSPAGVVRGQYAALPANQGRRLKQ
jgi:hypothetical protein